jgi:hypothetical protein
LDRDEEERVPPKIKYLILDILKPHIPSIVDLSKGIASNVDGIEKVVSEIVEMDQDTESIKMQVYGKNINLDMLVQTIKSFGASLHSIDEVIVEND